MLIYHGFELMKSNYARIMFDYFRQGDIELFLDFVQIGESNSIRKVFDVSYEQPVYLINLAKC